MKIKTDRVQSIEWALQEDRGSGDVTADLIPADAQSNAKILCRDDAVLCGVAWVDETFHQVDAGIKINWYYQDGDHIKENTILCDISGHSRGLLSGERVALNFLQLLSATATLTAVYVKAIAESKSQILDTRKTIPGLRTAQKYAVTCGGGVNHRIGLYDRVLIKENHIMAAGSIEQAVSQAKQLHKTLLIEVEAETMDEFAQAQAAGADIIMLDNFSLENMRIAVAENALNKGKIKLEASGGINLETIQAIAETGVDYISIGEITKNITAVDLSMRIES
ncbi:MAG: carboxylating nicotinate-nucleotide diphosphorylase [Thiotrichaceae bacterium]|nr:carboxylating nicotinate-nucleotide diphosphorylase [Thiotrichaceae bacterium]